MKIKIFQVDAFTSELFKGNPAAVCILNGWLSNGLMQSIAAENNLAETAFIVKSGEGYAIRWFTPTVEVDLCGHATLASAHVIFNHIGYDKDELVFSSPRSGILRVTRQGALLTLNFPADEFKKVDTPSELIKGLGMTPLETYRGKTDYMAVLPSETDVANMQPKFQVLNSLACRGIIVTARGMSVDFVSRFFAPQSGIDEDPVTGSAHTTLIPYWHSVLNKTDMSAVQLSSRKGYLQCRYLGDRVEIGGHAVTYLQGEIEAG